MGKVLIIDITKCNGCHNCQIACKDEHCGTDWLPYAKAQPQIGQFWTRVIDKVRGTVPKVKVAYEHSICQHCDEAPCIKACPSKAIYKRHDGIVIIDPIKCQGNKKCIEACPFDQVIFFNNELNISQKCTFCAHLLDEGWKEPRCVDACPTGAFTFGEENDLRELIFQAEVLMPELGTKPRVYYIGLPKRFIAATLIDDEQNEAIIDARVEIQQLATGESKTTTTDDFGDFWTDNLLPGLYRVVIFKEGYLKKELNVDITEKDINLGEIALNKKT